MQISWIDPNQINTLLKELGHPQDPPAAAPSAPPPPPEPLLPPSPEADTPTTSPTAETPAVPAQLDSAPEIQRIRQALEKVRQTALDAGLLRQPLKPTAAPTPPPEAAATPTSPFSPFSSVEAPTPESASDQPDEPQPPTDPAPDSDPPPSPGSLYFEVPLGSIVERLQALAAWIQQRHQPKTLFLLDESGDLLWGRQAHTPLILSALMAAKAAQRARATSAWITPHILAHQTLATDRILSIVSTPTAAGTIHLALEMPAALTEADARILSQAIRSTIEVITPAP